MKILIVGAGFAGSTFARLAAENNIQVDIIDQKNHIGGNSYSYSDKNTGIEIHKYGPHIFHTNSEKVYNFITRFCKLNNYINQVKAISNGNVFSLPITLHTINQFFGKTFSPSEAKLFIEQKRIKFEKIDNFEKVILNSIGKELYEAFFRDYTIKQWGKEPIEIPVSTAKRLPIRYNYNDNYFEDKYQGIPICGYYRLFKNILDHNNISILLNTEFKELEKYWKKKYDYLIYTGSIDEYFNNKLGKLPYRSVKFEKIIGTEIQGNAVINYTDMSVPFTRIHEHKYFTPNKKFKNSIGFKEFSLPFDGNNNQSYPIENREGIELFKQYYNMMKNEKNTVLIGRLAEFKYYNMDQVIKSSMNKFIEFYNSF